MNRLNAKGGWVTDANNKTTINRTYRTGQNNGNNGSWKQEQDRSQNQGRMQQEYTTHIELTNSQRYNDKCGL